jgi:hypothetical protein
MGPGVKVKNWWGFPRVIFELLNVLWILVFGENDRYTETEKCVQCGKVGLKAKMVKLPSNGYFCTDEEAQERLLDVTETA